MHLVNRLLKKFYKEHKALVNSFVFICSFQYVVNIIVTSHVYSKFFQKKSDMATNLRNVCILWMGKFVVSIIKTTLEERLFPAFASFLRHNLFCDYIKANQIHFDDTNVAADVRDMLELGQLIRDFYSWVAQIMIPTGIFLIIMIGFFMYKFPKVGVITFISAGVNLMIGRAKYMLLVKDLTEKHAIRQQLTDKFEEMLQNLMNVFINDKIEECKQENLQLENKLTPVVIDEHRQIKVMTNLMRINTYVCTGLSLLFLYRSSPLNEFLNGLFIYNFYISTLENLFEDLPNSVRSFTKMKMLQDALYEKVFKKLNWQTPSYPLGRLHNFQGKIQFENVCFSYDKKVPVLNHLNWTIHQGERVALIAKSGSGKTTAMKLLLKFYQPTSGRILLDQTDISEVDPQELRQRVNYVNQKTLLFQDTIVGNMQYGNSRSPEEIVELLRNYNLLHIFRECDRNPDRCLFNTIETNGTNMSMGMQKVIFLVRGLLRQDSPVCILDEPMSSVDPASRGNVSRMIHDLIGNRTLIIITHDDVTHLVHRSVHLDQLQTKDAQN